MATSEDELFVTNKKKRRIIRREYSSEGEENDSIFYKTPPKLKRNLLGNSEKGNWFFTIIHFIVCKKCAYGTLALIINIVSL